MIECVNSGSVIFVRNYSETDSDDYSDMLSKANQALKSVKSKNVTVDIGLISAKKNGLKCFLTLLTASKKTDKKITVKVSKDMGELVKYLGLNHILKTIH